MRVGALVDRILPTTRRRRLRRPARLGTLRRLSPLSERWGADRGRPIDRYYIEQFLHLHRDDIRGTVFEIKDRTYTERFGTAVDRSEVLDVDSENERATIVADLGRAGMSTDVEFDCAIVTQTLQYVYELDVAIRNLHSMLTSGGVLLATVPAVSMVVDADGLRDYWRLTEASCALLFSRAFGATNVTTASYGNVLASIAFLTGMAQEELRASELDTADPRFPVIVGVRAVKSQVG
jgi:hypothetical protein